MSPIPPVPPGFTLAEFGELLWGSGLQGATERLETINREQLRQLGLTYEIARLWREFYVEQTIRGRGKPTSDRRVELLDKYLQLLSVPETPTE